MDFYPLPIFSDTLLIPRPTSRDVYIFCAIFSKLSIHRLQVPRNCQDSLQRVHNNGRSNFIARYSEDGKFLFFLKKGLPSIFVVNHMILALLPIYPNISGATIFFLACQTETIIMVDASSQTIQLNTTAIQEHLPLIRDTCVAVESEHGSETDSTSSLDQDDGWKPTESSGSESEEIEETDWNEKKFLIFESCLMQLFVICSTCLAPIVTIKKSLFGSMLKISAECHNGHQTNWSSQPVHNRMPLGNLFIAASCLFSGSQCSKLFTFFNHLKMPSIAIRTYSDIQRGLLIPTIISVWKKCQQQLFAQLTHRQLVLGGDARMDSPGHSAKYGSYSLMDLRTNKILDLQLVQVQVFLYAVQALHLHNMTRILYCMIRIHKRM